MAGSPTEGIKTVLYPVSDLDKTKALYAALLGVDPQVDSPHYVGFDAKGQHIGLVPRGGPQDPRRLSPTGTWRTSKRSSPR